MSENSKKSGGGKASTIPLHPKKSQNHSYFVIRINKNSKILDIDLGLYLRENFARVAAQLESGIAGQEHYQIVANSNPKRTCALLTRKFCDRWPHLKEHLDSEGRPDDHEWYLRPQRIKLAQFRYAMKDDTKVEGGFTCYKSVPRPLILKEPYGWQSEVLQIIDMPPDGRTIYWIWEPTGRRGKTSFAKWLCAKRNAVFLAGAKKHCLATAMKACEQGVDLFVFGCPRSKEDGTLPVSYDALESLKDGLFHSGFGVEATGMVNVNPPHVIMFCNEEPDRSRLSADRWQVGRIVDQEIRWNEDESDIEFFNRV